MMMSTAQQDAPGYYVAIPQVLPMVVTAPQPFLPPQAGAATVPYFMYNPQAVSVPMWSPSEIPTISDVCLPPLAVDGRFNTPPAQGNLSLEPRKDSLSLPRDSCRSRSRSSSCESSLSLSDCSSYSFSDDQPQRGHKKLMITQIQQDLEELLGLHFPLKMEGDIMHVFAHQFIPDLDEQEDVLRGTNVGNIRAKSVSSLSVLVEFLQAILLSPQVHVHRVDVILQRKRVGHLKGLLVNIEFSSQKELLYVRDAIWRGQGYEEQLPKFMPAVFAQDCSWTGGHPKDLLLRRCAEGELRVQHPLPQKLQDLGLEAPCRIKSMSVVWHTSSKKRRTFEVPKEQFLSVLSEGKFVMKGRQHTVNADKHLTVSFEEDWKTDFWRS